MVGVGARDEREPADARGGGGLTPLQRFILAYVEARCANGAEVVSSRELARVFNVCHTYAREQAHALVLRGLLDVRPGRTGGYCPRFPKVQPSDA